MRGPAPGAFPTAGTAEWCLVLGWWLAVVRGGMYVRGWDGALCATWWEYPGSEFSVVPPQCATDVPENCKPWSVRVWRESPQRSLLMLHEDFHEFWNMPCRTRIYKSCVMTTLIHQDGDWKKTKCIGRFWSKLWFANITISRFRSVSHFQLTNVQLESFHVCFNHVSEIGLGNVCAVS